MKLPKHVQTFLNEYSPRKEILGRQHKQEQDNKDDENENQKPSCCLLVVSSFSGNGMAARQAPKVAQYLSRNFSKVVLVPTQHGGHCREILNTEPSLQENFKVVVILGGDGAFSEAVNGMMTRKDDAMVPLAHAPGGSGCGMSGNLIGTWKYQDLEKACDIIAKHKVGKIDVNQITCADGKNRYSVCVVSVGSFADICKEADAFKWTYGWFGPSFRYFPGIIQAYRKYGKRDSNRPVRVDINDGEEVFETSCFAMALYNIGEVTHNLEYTDQHKTSGSLTLQLCKHYAGSVMKHLNYAGAVAKRKDLKPEIQEIHFERDITSIKVEPIHEKMPNGSRPIQVFLDGEEIKDGNDKAGYAPFTSRVLPSALAVIVA